MQDAIDKPKSEGQPTQPMIQPPQPTQPPPDATQLPTYTPEQIKAMVEAEKALDQQAQQIEAQRAGREAPTPEQEQGIDIFGTLQQNEADAKAAMKALQRAQAVAGKPAPEPTEYPTEETETPAPAPQVPPAVMKYLGNISARQQQLQAELVKAQNRLELMNLSTRCDELSKYAKEQAGIDVHPDTLFRKAIQEGKDPERQCQELVAQKREEIQYSTQPTQVLEEAPSGAPQPRTSLPIEVPKPVVFGPQREETAGQKLDAGLKQIKEKYRLP